MYVLPTHAPQAGEGNQLEVELPDLDYADTGRNTIVITATVDSTSEKIAVNICPPNYEAMGEIALHFNPRQFERGGRIVINNKAEHHWGRDERLQLGTVAPIFGLKKAQYVFQITNYGFRIMVNGHFIHFFDHRLDPPRPGEPLILQLPPFMLRP